LTRPGEARRDEIIAKAIDVFGESGYAGARIHELARRVGIRQPSVLYHFPDKAALYAAALGSVVAEISRRVEAAQASPRDRLESIADAWIDFVVTRPNAARLLLRQMIDAHPIPIRSIEAPVQALMVILQAAIEEHAGPEAAKALDAAEFALVLASSSLVWVASRSAVEETLGLDTLSPLAIERHRRMLHALTRQLIAASQDARLSPAPGS
jgi:TetR/AcrR family transcriptional regulator